MFYLIEMIYAIIKVLQLSKISYQEDDFMSKKQDLSISLLNELQTSGAGYDVLRYISLPHLLGPEADTIFYFMGKDLARSLNIKSADELYYAADKLGWGRLELVKENKRSLTFNLMADAVFLRLQASFDVDFRLEAGFIAEAVRMINGIECECTEKINAKIHQVEFKVYYTE